MLSARKTPSPFAERARTTLMIAAALTLASVWTAPVSAAPLIGIKGGGDDAEKWLVDNPELVMTFSIKQMTESALLKANLPMLKELIKNNEEAKKVLEETGIDPFKDVESVLVSGSGNSAQDAKLLTVVRGKFDTDKIHATLKKAAEKKESELELVKEGQVQLYQFKKDDKVLVAGFASKSVLVITNSKEATADAIKNGGKNAAKMSKEMKAALGKFTGKETLTVAVVVNEELKKLIEKAPRLGEAGAKLQTLTASLTVTDGVALNVTGNTSEKKAAKQLAGGLQLLKAIGQGAVQGMEDLPPVLGEILEAVKIAAEQDSVTVDLKVTKAMIEKATKPAGN
jgi:hypothetical protein